MAIFYSNFVQCSMQRLGNKGVITCGIIKHLYCKYFMTKGYLFWYVLHTKCNFPPKHNLKLYVRVGKWKQCAKFEG